MKMTFRIIAAIMSAAIVAGTALAAHNVTNTVLMVDQHNNLNVEGVASVEDVTTNAVNVRIAKTAANVARATALEVTNQLNGICANIMSNNVVIYRSGFTDSFEGLVIYTEDDTMAICEYEKVSLESGVLRSRIGYVCTADIGTIKPKVMAHDTLAGGTNSFVQVSDDDVTTPVIHEESRTLGGTTYSKWYEIWVDISVSGTAPQYFYFIKVSGDTPGGDGATLELPNGVTGGATGTFTWGDKLMVFRGGVLVEARDAN